MRLRSFTSRLLQFLILILSTVAVSCGGPSAGSALRASDQAAAVPEKRREPAPESGREIDRLVAEALTAPPIKAEDPAFTAELVVPPGDFYDPMSVKRGPNGTILIGDDGSREERTGGRIWLFDPKSKQVSIYVDTRRLLPVQGMDLAPASWGPYSGGVIVSSPPGLDVETQQTKGYLIQYVRPEGTQSAKPLCQLPAIGPSDREVAAGGVEAMFPPKGSPFGDKFYNIMHVNSTIYTATADGVCKPFATVPGARGPGPRPNANMNFNEDGSKLWVSYRQGSSKGEQGFSGLIGISPNGTFDSQPVYKGDEHHGIDAIAIAPSTFGPYAGQIFMVVGGYNTGPTGAGESMESGQAKVYRVASTGGQAYLVASGFGMAWSIAFIDNALWIGDTGRDFIMGGYYMPDGFLVRIGIK